MTDDVSKLFNKFSYFNIDLNNAPLTSQNNAPLNPQNNAPLNSQNIQATIIEQYPQNKIIQATNIEPYFSKKNKKKNIPKHIKTIIWNKYIGEDIIKHRCLCCKKEIIRNTDFEAGHVLSVFNGGTDEVDNLRPICRPCNASMGTMHMIEYIKMYGLYI